MTVIKIIHYFIDPAFLVFLNEVPGANMARYKISPNVAIHAYLLGQKPYDHSKCGMLLFVMDVLLQRPARSTIKSNVKGSLKGIRKL